MKIHREQNQIKAAFSHVDSQLDHFVEELGTWVRQPSISADGTGMHEMVHLVQEKLSILGGRVRIEETDGGYPLIIGEFDGESDFTLLSYNHYDVQPAGSRADWNHDPFSGEIVEGRLFGRGSADNKGCLLARIHAVESILKTRGSMPIKVKFLIEGEEEIGSPHLEGFVQSNREVLQADACIWEYAAKDALGRATATLGNKGMCYVELSARTAHDTMHSMYANLIPNAAWRLIWALGTLKDADDTILISGFYDHVEPLSQEEIQVINQAPIDTASFAKEAGVKRLLVQDQTAAIQMFGAPTCTICGLISGHTGEGSRTVLPAVATAKVDFRLVVSQDPEDILNKLRQHLDRHGFEDIEIRPLSMARPAKTPVNHPFSNIVCQSAAMVFDHPLVLQPTSPGTGPRSIFTGWTKMPIVGLGIGHIGSQIHGPNENIYLRDYQLGIKHMIAIMYHCTAAWS